MAPSRGAGHERHPDRSVGSSDEDAELLPAELDPFPRDEIEPAADADEHLDPDPLRLLGGRAADRLRLTPGSIVRAILLVGVYIVLLQVVVAAATPLVWFAEGVIGAALLFPVTAILERKMPRGLAVTVVSVGLVAVIALVGLRIFTELKSEAEQFNEQAQSLGTDLESNPSIGNAAKQFGAKDKLTNLAESALGALNFENASVSTLSTAASLGSAVFIVWLFGVMMLLAARRFIDGGLAQVQEESRRQHLVRICSVGYANAWRYVAYMVSRSLAYGTATFAMAWIIGLRVPTLVAVWVAAWSLVPTVGVMLGWSLVVVVGLFVSVPAAIALAVGGIVLQVLDIYLVQRRIDEGTVHLGPALVLLVSIVGFALYGLGGVVLAFSITCFGVAVLDELRPSPMAEPASAARFDTG